MAVIKIANIKGQIDCPNCFSLLQWDSTTDVHCFSGIEYVICPECGQHLMLDVNENYWFGSNNDSEGLDDQNGSSDVNILNINDILIDDGNTISLLKASVDQMFENTPELIIQSGDIEFELIPTPHEDMHWFEDYNDENNLWPYNDESSEHYNTRIAQFFNALIAQNEEEGTALKNKFDRIARIYYALYEISYPGEWGESLGDFFNPADNTIVEYENTLLYIKKINNIYVSDFIFICQNSAVIIGDKYYQYNYLTEKYVYLDNNEEPKT